MIERIYDEIEKQVNDKLDEYEAYFEIFDVAPTSDGWITIKETDDREEEILEILQNTINDFDGVKIVIDDIPTLDVEYYYNIHIDIELAIYNRICKEEEKQKQIMANAIIDEYIDFDGTIIQTIVFEDEIERELGGDIYRY